MSNRRIGNREAEAEGRRDDYANGIPTSGPVAKPVLVIDANCCDSFSGREVNCFFCNAETGAPCVRG